MRNTSLILPVAGFVGVACAPAMAGFGGQTINGPLSDGSVVIGSLFGQTDDNDGFTSGDHFFDIWDGLDIVYGLNWTGGNMLVTLTPLDLGDPDLFVYRPTNLDDSGDYSITNAVDTVQINNAPAGFYYIIIDTTAGGEGDFQLAVTSVPAPGALSLIGAAALCGRRRRRG